MNKYLIWSCSILSGLIHCQKKNVNSTTFDTITHANNKTKPQHVIQVRQISNCSHFSYFVWFIKKCAAWGFFTLRRLSLVYAGTHSFLANSGLWMFVGTAHRDISDKDERKRETPAAEYPITECAIVWASVHGPEPLIYTHRSGASRTDWPDFCEQVT